jgi:hypothetical protein
MLRTLDAPTAPADPEADAAADSPLAAWALRRGLPIGLGLLVAAQLAAWVPHYLTWPWWSDHDVFATLALGWERGWRPYRDLVSNNFPGTIYLFWVVGKLAGWGRTWAFYALDAALVLAFGAVLLAWSRRRFGRALPGLVGFAAWLGYYLNLDHTQTAQRDWQGPALAVLGLLASEAWPGRAGRFASGLLAAAGFATRPQTALLWPALAYAAAPAPRSPLRPPAGWLAALAVGLALAFAPIAVAGVLPDFLACVRGGALGASYFRVTPGSFAAEMARQLTLADGIVLAGSLLLMGAAPGSVRRTARTWLGALALVLLYRPSSPTPHAYLDHPHRLVLSVNLAVLAGLVLEAGPMAVPSAFRLVAALSVLGLGATLRPEFANPATAARAVPDLRAGREPAIEPMGYRRNPSVMLAALYAWDDYRAALDYLRSRTGPETRVANALEGVPALTGPAARLPAFPAESIAWLRVRPGDEAAFAGSLDAAGADSVVVWAPSEIGHRHRENRDFALPLLEPVIRRRYAFEAAFGPIEVWRRRPETPAP